MIDAPDGFDTVFEALAIGCEQGGEGGEGECDVFETGRVALFWGEGEDVHEGDSVVLVVVGEEGDAGG